MAGEYAPIGRDARRLAVRRSQEGVGGDRGRRMARHFDFRHDLHMAGRRETNDAAHLVLGVVAAVARAVRIDAPGAHGSQAWMLADFEPPALIVGQMPVQHIELMPGHPVDHGANGGGGLKVPGGVEHQASPGVRRCIADGLRGNLPGIAARRQQLPESDGAVEQSGRRARRNSDLPRRDLDPIAFGAEAAPAAEPDRIDAGRPGTCGADDRQGQMVGTSPQLNEIAGGGGRIAIA